MTEPSPLAPAPSPIGMDVLIVGAGPVGMTLALALAGGPWRIALVDARPRGAYAKDPRALALSHGTRQLLERLDAWNAGAATPIREIHVSQRQGFGRTLIDADDCAVPALGYVMRYRDLAAALDAQLPAGSLLDACEVLAIAPGADAQTVTLRRGGETWQVKARLVVHAEGTPDGDAAVEVRDYRQHAVLAEVRPQPEHRHRAWERFTPDGPLALLPLGDDYSVVFTVPPEKAGQLLALDDAAFLGALQAHFGQRLGFTATGPRARYPLALRFRPTLVRGREVWIGNTAQTLHPVSGQGFNLGLRDAWELAETLLANRGADPGDARPLAAYARRRQPDRRGGMAFTDGIVRLFSNDIAPLRLARGLGLLALDLCPPARRFVARRMIWGARAWP